MPKALADNGLKPERVTDGSPVQLERDISETFRQLFTSQLLS